MDRRVQKVIALINDDPHRGASFGRLAVSVNLSPSRLHQLFKDETGLSPGKYLRLLRMQKAKELLESTFLSVKQVMSRAGVADESHFVRDFKRAYGLTPAQYRSQFQNGRPGKDKLRGRDVLTSVPALVRPRAISHGSAPSSSPSDSTTPPLLLRRPSHPHQLNRDKISLRSIPKFNRLAELLRLRHIAFAELTTELTASIARGKLGGRIISYRPRPGVGVAYRLPPAAERPRALRPRPPRSAHHCRQRRPAREILQTRMERPLNGQKKQPINSRNGHLVS